MTHQLKLNTLSLVCTLLLLPAGLLPAALHTVQRAGI